MDELEVEAVEEIDPVTDVGEGRVPAGVEAPDVVLYGGKGGVGKTTMAAATALASARDGTPTLVVSTDPAHSLSDTLGVDVPAEPTRIGGDDPLYAAEIDPEAVIESEGVLGEDAPAFGMGMPGGENPLQELLGEGGVPGADEVAAMRVLLEHVDDPRFSRVVVDTAPTGHTLRLLELPELMDSLLGRVITLRERFSTMLEGLNPFAEGDGADGPDLEDFKRRIEHLEAVLTDPTTTDFRIVTVPETMSVREADRLRETLGTYGVPVRTVVVNRVLEDPASVVGADVAGDLVGPDHADCPFCARRWEVQQDALADAMDRFREHDLKRVPLLAREVSGPEALSVVAACLHN